MARYPQLFAGQRLTASLLNSMVPIVVTKAATNSITSNATLTLDPELSGIALSVGTWSIEVILLASAASNSATIGNLKVAWSFSGALANSPVRITSGPADTNTAIPGRATPINVASNGSLASGQAYGLAVSSSAAYARITEECYEFQVSSAGNFGILVAQNTSAAVATNVRTGSTLILRQVG